MLIADAATVHPARLARGLRRLLLESGVRIFEHTTVTRLGMGRPVVAETPGGTVRAGDAVIGLGAWATWWKAFRPRLTLRGSYMVITAPAPDRLEELGWTGGEAIRDLRSSIHYLRTTPDGRIAFGLGGLQPDLARRIDHRYDYEPRYARRVAERPVPDVPELRGRADRGRVGRPDQRERVHDAVLRHARAGQRALRPRVHRQRCGPSHLGGKILAALALHVDDGFTRLAVVTRKPKRFPPEPIRSPGAFVVNAAIRRKDDREDAGRRVGAVTRAIARLPRRLGYHLGPR